MHRPARRIAPIVCLAILAAAATPASAQYFGQNKVQYKTFDFKVLHTEHFDIYFYPEERPGIELASRMAERWYARLSRAFQHQLTGRQPLIIYASSSDFQQTNVITGELGEGTGGVTESVRRRIVLPFAGPLADTDHVIGHELVHAFQYDIAAQLARNTGDLRSSGIGALPLWFIEGMAEYYSIGSRSPLTAMWMRDAVRAEKLPSIRDLNNPEYFPYRWGQALWAYIGGRWGDQAVANLLKSAVQSGDIDQAFRRQIGISEKELSDQWHAALRRMYEPMAEDTSPIRTVAKPITPGSELGQDMNVSPALSPDGRRVAFLSSRSLFSVDLYVADAETGKVLRRLTSTDVNPHYSSLQFISSAGTWDPQGRQLAVTAVTSGRPVLAIYDVDRGDRTREIRLQGLDGAFNPSWSPDGRRVVLVGMKGGLTDLFMLDLTSGALAQMTNDAYAELHPAWSPDGSRIAFATDRFTTDLRDVAAGEFRIGLLDVGSHSVRPLNAFDRGKQIDPQWSADGRSVYFIGEPDGISNVYRVSVDGGDPLQVTDLFTGVSGITESSPALTAGGNRLTVSVFEKGDYRLYTIDDAKVLAGSAPRRLEGVDAAQLPPPQRAESAVAALLHNETVGLPPPAAAPRIDDYHPRLQLDYVGQPTFSIGADRFGAFGGGGLAFFMSDTLGDHNLATAIQVNSSFGGDFSGSDIGGAVMYTNLRRRWNWGVEADQTPYRSGFVTGANAIINGEPVGIEQATIFRETDRGVSAMAAYPFSRAHRFEVSAGYRNLNFSQQIRTTGYSLITGDVLFDDKQKSSPFDSLNLAQTSAALVYDTASFGATSPILGQRYRFEVSPMFGSIDYTGLLLDYRRYFMPVRLYTIAARVLHYGRYGNGAEDQRLSPLFIGYPELVRGYDVGTFQAGECQANATSSCPALDRLIGSRMLVGNLEFRFPLLRPFGLRQGVYGPVPIEAALFADGGIAWSSGDKPSFFGGDRKGVSSVGAALRVNALGFAVLQFDMARPLQRPGRGWVFQFSLTPGF